MRTPWMLLVLMLGLLAGCEAAYPNAPVGDAGAPADGAIARAPDAVGGGDPDSGATMGDDASASGDDASASGDDASATPTDASATPTDASATTGDDASATPTDASATPTDATAGPTDASVPSDGGRANSDATPGDAATSDAGDPCAAVSCAQVPPPVCVNNTTVRTFSGVGACAMGQCTFPFADTTCADRCSQGACVVLTCGAARCDAPPGPVCVDAQTIRRAAPIGRCDAAGMTCGYATADSVCSQGCAGTACAPGSWLATAVDDDGRYPAIAVDPLDQPHIAFFHGAELRVASWSDRGWTVSTVDSGLGQTVPMIATDGSGGVHVVYDELQNHNVRYAYRAYGAPTFTVEFVATAGDVYPLALGIDAQGVPTVAYRDRTNGTIVAARRAGASNWTVTHSMMGGAQNGRGKLQFGPANEPYLAYGAWRPQGTSVVVSPAVLATPAGNTWTVELLPAKFVSGFVRRSNGEAHVLLSDLATGLTAHHRTAAGVWSQEAIDPLNSPSSSLFGDLAIDAQGELHAGYYRYVLRTTDHGLTHARYAAGTWTLEPIYDPPSLFDGAGVAMALGPTGAVHFAAMVSTSRDLLHVAR